MTRRHLLAASLSPGLAGLTGQAGAQKPQVQREHYEFRLYTFSSEAAQARFLAYLRDALLPALKRLGNGPSGVFTPVEATEHWPLYFLIPHASLQAFESLPARLDADPAYRTDGAAVLDLPATDPPYLRIESWLLEAFASHPHLTVPAQTAAGKGRSFELRTYESHNEKAARKKIEMFDSGETAIFVRNGFQPVFYGAVRIGSGMPALTYMVTYEDGVARDVYWKRFSVDPETKRLFAIPEYADKLIVSKIHSTMLRPTAFSQI
jgi:hypothetical protein